jgi:hypothetical protein
MALTAAISGYCLRTSTWFFLSAVLPLERRTRQASNEPAKQPLPPPPQHAVKKSDRRLALLLPACPTAWLVGLKLEEDL